tara:strand:+ start:748 stop:2115 length:1368 start_codon:yes stop_codon:yes gene_type:complete
MIALFPLEVKVREFLPKIFLAYELIKKHNFKILISKSRFLTSQLPYLKNAIYLDKSISKEKDFILKKVKKNNFYTALDEEGPMLFWPKFFFETRLNDAVLKKTDTYFLRGHDELKLVKKYKPNLKNLNLRVIGHPKYDLLKPKVRHIFDRDVEKIKKKFKKFVFISSSFFLDIKGGEHNYVQFLKEKYANTKTKKKNLSKVYKQWKEDSINYTSLIEIIKKLSIKFPKINFVFRPHPTQDIHKVRNRFGKIGKNVHVEYNYSVTPWIIACDYYFHSHCTTSYEAAILNKKILSFKKKNLGHEIPYSPGYNFNKANEFISFFSKNETKIEKYNFIKNKMPKKFIHNLSNSKLSTKLIANEFLNLINSNSSTYSYPKQTLLGRCKINVIDLAKIFLNNFYYFFGIKKRQNEKFKNTSVKEILNYLNLFQAKLKDKNKINFSVNKIDHQIFLIRKKSK